ncbi:MAG: response regulator [Selenomonadaceae bacterium]|nr:response regulator [Selenomonadaceae bacterium]MBR4384552.1 response regulator [Selenomonadaceae bacterium]
MRKKTILVIDDDEMNLQIARMLLEKKLPCEVVCASSGSDGLEILRNRRVNLVLLDILMPEFDGIETLREIRDDERIKNVPVMMLTASGDVGNIKKVGMLGVKDYIKKPFMPADLIKRIEEKLAEINSADILLIGDDENELHAMKEIIEKNFPHEARTVATFDAAVKILCDTSFDLIIADSNMKFVDGFKILQFVAANEKLSAIPFTLTTSEKILEVINEINALQVEKNFSAEPQSSKKVDEPSTIHGDKKKIANVVTNLIGCQLDVHI